MPVSTMPEISKEAVSQGAGTHQYYRQPNGWIKPAAIGKIRDNEGSEERTYRGRGWTKLPKYGRFPMTEHLLEHPLEVLFIRGGVTEVPLDQIQEQGWDHHPPSVPWCYTVEGALHKEKFGYTHHRGSCGEQWITIEFPQLKGVTRQVVEPCDFCEREDLPTEKARKQHMYVMHNKELSEIRTGEIMAEALSKQTQTMIAANPFLCGTCQDGFETTGELAAHVKLHRDTDPT